jgi:alpha-ketoglutarate-dependent taurine dioxygenase
VLALSNCLGRIIAQDRRGTLLADIVDTSEDAAASVSRFTDLPFHVDNAWGTIFPDYMGLLCLQPAKAGGDLQLVSGFSVLTELARLDGDLVNCLEEPFRYRASHQLLPGEEAHAVMPILWREGGDLSFRFLRFQVDESALTLRQRQAFDALERILRRPELSFTHALARGEMCLVNNHWVLHKRERFENAESPRHHLRLWLARNGNGLRKEGGPQWQRAHLRSLSAT